MPIENVSDTARWVAFYRAMETERPDALFRDPYARALAGPEGERIVKEMPRGRASSWAMITRTVVFDEIILDVVRRHDIDMVLNLAAGLDARPWRLAVAGVVAVDGRRPAGDARVQGQPHARRAPACQYEAMPANLVDAGEREAVFGRLGPEATEALVVTEGLLIYLTDEQVAALATELHTTAELSLVAAGPGEPRPAQAARPELGKDAREGERAVQVRAA